MPQKAQESSSSQVINFDFNRRASTPVSTTSGPINRQATDVEAGDRNTVNLPVVFQGNAVPSPLSEPAQRPHLVAVPDEKKSARSIPSTVRINQVLQTVLVAMCGMAIFAYGIDVVVSHDVGRLQQQARRLSEQNSELSAKLLRAISYGELQDSVVGRFGLRVPDHVKIVDESPAPAAKPFRHHRHELPLMSGY